MYVYNYMSGCRDLSMSGYDYPQNQDASFIAVLLFIYHSNKTSNRAELRMNVYLSAFLCKDSNLSKEKRTLLLKCSKFKC